MVGILSPDNSFDADRAVAASISANKRQRQAEREAAARKAEREARAQKKAEAEARGTAEVEAPRKVAEAGPGARYENVGHVPGDARLSYGDAPPVGVPEARPIEKQDAEHTSDLQQPKPAPREQPVSIEAGPDPPIPATQTTEPSTLTSAGHFLCRVLVRICSLLSLIFTPFGCIWAIIPTSLKTYLVALLTTLLIIYLSITWLITTSKSYVPTWYCTTASYLPLPGCTTTKPVNALPKDTLEGCTLRLPDTFPFLGLSLTDVQEHLENLDDARLGDVGGDIASTAQWTQDYHEATKWAQEKRDELRTMTTEAWKEINQYVRQFPVSEVAEQGFWSRLFYGDMVEARARRLTKGLLEILTRHSDKFTAFFASLAHNEMMAVWEKLSPQQAEHVESLVAKAASILADNEEAQDTLKAMDVTTGVWVNSSRYMIEILVLLQGMLAEHKVWLQDKVMSLKEDLGELEGGRGRYGREEWRVRCEEVVASDRGVAIEWRGKVKGYYWKAEEA